MPNHLLHESSPYLQQHIENPVDWYPWGEEALQKAKAQNKPLLVSIGYAACHWCHVMAHESFEDEQVAQLMNEHFVCIKVDREERPDVDKIYMDAVMLMTGRGGWPLNAIALPDGRPIYGGTYFRKDQWMSALQQVADFYQQDAARAQEYATELVSAMSQMDMVELPSEVGAFTENEVTAIAGELLQQVDREWGGRNVQANKFPLPLNHRFMLRMAHFQGDAELQDAVNTSLEKMALGGIYDQLGGGFARYSVDPYWKVPHFEKMLYDNGQMLSLYAEAYLQQPRPLYQRVLTQTIEFVQRELTAPNGGFYASLDADSEGVEGKFYTWTYPEAVELLGDDLQPFADYYNLQPAGNWEEGRNILFALETEAAYAERWKLDLAQFQADNQRGREVLLAARASRIRPGLDDKLLASWNGLMLNGLVDAYRALQDPPILDLALRNAAFIRDHLAEGTQLYRSHQPAGRRIPGFLDDYANVIAALINLYQVTFDEQWLAQADGHLQAVLTYFDDPETGLFFYTSEAGETLVRRKTERQDDVIPASNSVLAHSLLTLGVLLDRPDYRERAEHMVAVMKNDLVKLPMWHSHWGELMLRFYVPQQEIAVLGAEARAFRLALEAPYGPNRLFAGSTEPSKLPLLQDRFEAQTTIYVCQDYACQLPVQSVAEAREQLAKG
jgi:hypothetical protein